MVTMIVTIDICTVPSIFLIIRTVLNDQDEK
jgi:hypothetical protein